MVWARRSSPRSSAFGQPVRQLSMGQVTATVLGGHGDADGDRRRALRARAYRRCESRPVAAADRVRSRLGNDRGPGRPSDGHRRLRASKQVRAGTRPRRGLQLGPPKTAEADLAAVLKPGSRSWSTTSKTSTAGPPPKASTTAPGASLDGFPRTSHLRLRKKVCRRNAQIYVYIERHPNVKQIICDILKLALTSRLL